MANQKWGGAFTKEGLFTCEFFRRYCLMLPLSIHSETMTSSGPCIYAPIKGRVLGSESLFHMITSWQNLCHQRLAIIVRHSDKTTDLLYFLHSWSTHPEFLDRDGRFVVLPSPYFAEPTAVVWDF